MPKISKTNSKKTNTKVKKTISSVKKTAIAIKKIKAPIKISKTYIPKDTEKYMCDKHLSFFKIKLTEWKKEPCKGK